MEENGKTSVASDAASPVDSSQGPTPDVSPSEHHSSSSDSLEPHFNPRHDALFPNRIYVAGFDHKVASDAASPVDSSQGPTPDVSPSEHHSSSSDSLEPHFNPRHDALFPNRIYVTGFDHKVSERDLWSLFSECGTVTEVNIMNRSRRTKCYGFVTFEDPEVVRKLLNDVNGVYFKDRRLCIRQAFRKHVGSENFHRSVFSVEPELVSCETMYLTTSSGSPYTFHNGVAYFQNPRASPSAHLWTPPPAPVMVSQPRQLVYHQTACHHYQPQSFPNHYQWNSAESPVGAALVMCAQPEYFQLVSEGVSQPLMDDSSAEYFDPALYQTYPVYPLRAERVPRFVPHHEYGKNHVYSTVSVPPPLPPVTISYFRDPSDPENQGPPSVLQ